MQLAWRGTQLASLLPAALLAAGCAGLPITPAQGTVLFQDDFSRSSSGWDRYRDSDYATDYAGGTFQIAVFAPHRMAWALPGLSFGDVALEVEAFPQEGPTDNALGLICRYQDPDNFYFFLVSSDGYAGIGQRLNGEQRMFNDAAMLPAEAVQPGMQVNRLRAECVGPVLSLYINGTLSRQALSDTWSEGDVGLIAGTYDTPGVNVAFDNFAVRQPAPWTMP
jgi:hypothetical protein